MKKYIHKVAGGKLLIIKIEITQNLIKKFQLLGDFFLYPEEKITLIEKSLINASQNEVHQKLTDIIKKENIMILGFNIDDLVLLINQAFSDENNR